jgi:hypothetical protein
MIEWFLSLEWYWILTSVILTVIIVSIIVYGIYQEYQWSKSPIISTTGIYDGRDIDTETGLSISPVVGFAGSVGTGVAVTSSDKIIYKTYWKIEGLELSEQNSENLYRKCRKLKDGTKVRIEYKLRGDCFRIIAIDVDNDGVNDL